MLLASLAFVTLVAMPALASVPTPRSDPDSFPIKMSSTFGVPIDAQRGEAIFGAPSQAVDWAAALPGPAGPWPHAFPAIGEPIVREFSTTLGYVPVVVVGFENTGTSVFRGHPIFEIPEIGLSHHLHFDCWSPVNFYAIDYDLDPLGASCPSTVLLFWEIPAQDAANLPDEYTVVTRFVDADDEPVGFGAGQVAKFRSYATMPELPCAHGLAMYVTSAREKVHRLRESPSYAKGFCNATPRNYAGAAFARDVPSGRILQAGVTAVPPMTWWYEMGPIENHAIFDAYPGTEDIQPEWTVTSSGGLAPQTLLGARLTRAD